MPFKPLNTFKASITFSKNGELRYADHFMLQNKFTNALLGNIAHYVF